MAVNPQQAVFNPSALIAAAQRRTAFVPKIGDMLVVTMPGETMRCPVEKVIDDDTAIVKVTTPPISRNHTFRFDDLVGVRRRQQNGRDIWEAQRKSEFLAEQKRLSDAARSKKPKRKKT